MSFRRTVGALGALGVLAAVSAFLLFDAPSAATWRPTKVLIPKGASSSDAARLLADAKVLVHPAAFRLLITATLTETRLKFGEYAFPEPASAFEVWRKLLGGEVTRYAVTIPEGSNIYDIATLLAAVGLVDPEEFLATASSPAVRRRLDVPGDTVEGFLFPDTYQFVKSMTSEEIVEIMVRQFRRKVPSEWLAKGLPAGLSPLQVVTVASIIEKETGVEGEKPLVSAVVRNRLAIGMPLQMDPTVIYGLRRFGTELTKKDLQTPSPYNSYLKKGLPPGPIANPGLSALRAAVFPETADYLYFVSRNDGSHRFSKTLEEHNRGVAMYRRDRAAD